MAKDTPLAEKDAWLEARYRVKKINDSTGKHDQCRYFVLDPLHDPLARAALAAYRDAASHAGYDALATDLNSWLDAVLDSVSD